MKLLLCSEYYYPTVGGANEVVRQIAERLARRGHSVTVATGHHPLRDASMRINGVDVQSFRVTGNLVRGIEGEVDAYRRLAIDGGFDALLVKAAQQWTFDALAPVLGQVNARKYFIPCGFSHMHYPAYREYYAKMKGWLGAFDGLIFYASRYRDIDFAKACGLRRLHVVPNGVDEREFTPTDDHSFRASLGMQEKSTLLLSVGTLIAAKGHWEVIHAFDQAPLPRPAVLVVNANYPKRGVLGWMRREAAALRRGKRPIWWMANSVNRRHAGRKRVLLTDLPRPELIRAFKAADLFVSASVVEYSPLVLFESVAAGTPFLSSPVGNASEIAAWTEGGFVYDAKTDAKGNVWVDTSTLAKAMVDCISLEAGLAEKGRKGRERLFAQGYTWEAIVPRYEAILAGER